MMEKTLTVEDIARKLKPLFGEKIDNLYLKYQTADSYEEKNEISQALTVLYQKHLNKLLDSNILLDPPRKEFVNGEYSLAKVNYAGKDLFNFGLKEKDWPRHVCVTGMSGSGKTTFAFNILKNFQEKNKPFLVFDWKKSFRSLIAVDPKLMIFTVGNQKVSNLFKLNINRPPKGVAPKEWINVLCDLLTESFMVSFGVHKILLETLDEAYEGWGVYEGGKHYPNWEHIKKLLEQKARDSKGRETGWYESALRIASVLTFGSFGDVVNYDGKKALSIEDLFDKRVILELNSLSNTEKKFFAEFILTYIYKLKKAGEYKINQDFNHAILVDEAHNIFLKNKTHFVSESVTDMVYREMREYGTSLICLDQHVSKLSDTVKGNSAFHIAFQQQLPEDIRDISGIMQLSHKREMFSQLDVGTAIVKQSERHTSPFLVKVPFVDLRNNFVTDAKIKQRMDYVIKGVEIVEDDPEFLEQIKKPVKQEVITKEIGKQSQSNLKKYESSKKNISEEIIIEESAMPSVSLNTKPEDKVYTIDLQIPKKENLSFSKQEKPKIQKIEIPTKSKTIVDLNQREEILVEFIEKELDRGNDFNAIERLLEKGLFERQYSRLNTLNSITYVLGKRLGSDIKIKEQPKEVYVKTLSSRDFDKLSVEEKNFVSYLLKNPVHENATVEIYKRVGLSTRKGNIVKNNLMKKQMIEIKEQRNEKGWKKLIRLSPSYLFNLNQNNSA
ncbi:MAG: DUF87 domain-containing protein [Nanoarchaeota archaeon]|nr:DUF87 domain-containing protein [Nanoarchaeota archaeon]